MEKMLLGCLFIVAACAAPIKEVSSDIESCPSGMVLVPAGDFQMGCKDKRYSFCTGGWNPSRQVTINKAFCLDITEVTNKQYGNCVDSGKCPPVDEHQCWSLYQHLDHPVARFKEGHAVDYVDVEGHEGTEWRIGTQMSSEFFSPDHPVICVIWDEAKLFCDWIGKRLPTDAEWEKAARGIDGRIYPWGDERPSCDYAIMSEKGAGCGIKTTWPVGSRKNGVSPYGALDMAGNVWEWVDDECHHYNGNIGHVIRGGSWVSEDDYLFWTSTRGCGVRDLFINSYRFNSVGFRCASSTK